MDRFPKNVKCKALTLAALTIDPYKLQLTDFEHLIIDIDDLESSDLLSSLPRCMDFIYDNCQRGRVLVHWCVPTLFAIQSYMDENVNSTFIYITQQNCSQAGSSRSAAMIMAYLIATQRMNVTEALAKVKEVQPHIRYISLTDIS